MGDEGDVGSCFGLLGGDVKHRANDTSEFETDGGFVVENSHQRSINLRSSSNLMTCWAASAVEMVPVSIRKSGASGAS